jgi:hypothetical protein
MQMLEDGWKHRFLVVISDAFWTVLAAPPFLTS